MDEQTKMHDRQAGRVPDEFSPGTLGDHRQWCAGQEASGRCSSDSLDEERLGETDELNVKCIEAQRAELKKLADQRDALLEMVSVAHGIIIVAKNAGPQTINWEMTLKTLREAYIKNGGNANNI